VRLFLDAQLSGRAIGRQLSEQGHDVFVLDEHRELDGIDDHEVLALATGQGRILVTHNVRHFPDILREWAEAGQDHAGCIILVGMRLDQFGLILRAIRLALESGPDQEGWISRSVLVGRG
jgi:NAD(P)-dependent dehydrogenase (short-subunit alcohol dehydrogenase family)